MGIVSRGDLVRAFARSDAEIEEDIRRYVLHSVLISSDELDIQVDGGEVTLNGEVDAEFLTDVLPRAAERVPGVVGVCSEITTRGRSAARHH